MKEENKLTQLYENAFKDFSVEAPEATYAKVQNQLGRKSLLTLDPTRLNVFYLALISGVVAWAIIGNSSHETAEVDDIGQDGYTALAIDEGSSNAQTAVKVEESSTEVARTVSYETAIAENVTPKAPVLTTRDYAPPKPVQVTEEVLEVESVEVPDISPIEIIEEEVPSEKFGEISELNIPEEVMPTEEYIDMEERIEERELTRLPDALLEKPSNFLDRLKFERNNSVPFVVKTKYNKK